MLRTLWEAFGDNADWAAPAAAAAAGGCALAWMGARILWGG